MDALLSGVELLALLCFNLLFGLLGLLNGLLWILRTTLSIRLN